MLTKILNRISAAAFILRYPRFHRTFRQFKHFTMIPRMTYVKNLELIRLFSNTAGAIVECGTWRGGMIAGTVSVLGNTRTYYLFDSFEGLPDAKAIDGLNANKWQEDKDSALYFNNCKAEFEEAQIAMKISRASHVHIIKGWFNDTLDTFPGNMSIAVLRLDGDWYDSTMICLNRLYPRVIPGGLIIIDDYHVWEGCRRAVHDYLSREGLDDRICQWKNDVAYIIKSRPHER